MSTAKAAAAGIARLYNETDPRVISALRMWHDYRASNPIEPMDYIDLFHFDQRLGGWSAAIRQGRDANLPEVLTPANSWACVELLLSPPAARRREGVLQRMTTEILAPGLTQLAPINPPAIS